MVIDSEFRKKAILTFARESASRVSSRKAAGYNHARKPQRPQRVKDMLKKLFLISPETGKRIIAKGVLADEAVKDALRSHTLVVIAGSTNARIAAELLGGEFPADAFLRGCLGRRPKAGPFPGDVVMKRGEWDRGKEIFDVAGELGTGDVILKGANALDYPAREAAVLIADRRGGTALRALEAAVGRRTELIVPVGLEKRVYGRLSEFARRINSADTTGPRLLPLPGRVFTEMEAIRTLTGAGVELAAAGGIGGAEGSVLLLVEGSQEEVSAAGDLILSCGGSGF